MANIHDNPNTPDIPNLAMPSQTQQPPTTTSLDQFQTEEQRHVLDTVAQIRKCGLDGVVSLPQLVVCGDQSAGKSSVMEALTEIPFPRNDNLCTRFATEITLRRGPIDQLTLSIIPDHQRPSAERAAIQAFNETIVEFSDLPRVTEKAREAMGLSSGTLSGSTSSKAFARDVLSIVIEGPTRPQLTLVDVPGLIQSETKGVTRQDCQMVAEITESYIKQPRTICLAIVSATHDHANQPILTKVRDVDPTGERTLGIITKPDKLEPNSGNEAMFLSLARNEDIFFKLGWHVIKNRKFDEASFSFDERNASEWTFFRTSNFKTLPQECVGIGTLRTRLSGLLFEHIKRELPNLRRDLDQVTMETASQLNALGDGRKTARDCRNYLTQLSVDCGDLSKAAISGYYDDTYFQFPDDEVFSPDSSASIRRFRAIIQHLNRDFAEAFRQHGPKYVVTWNDQAKHTLENFADIAPPKFLARDKALDWVAGVMERSRGKEPLGNYNPLVIGELFWEQTEKWQALAQRHVDRSVRVCRKFFEILLSEKCPKDVQARLWTLQMTDALTARRERAYGELHNLMADNQDYPITYSHYYTDAIQKQQTERTQKTLREAVKNATSHTLTEGCRANHISTQIDLEAVVAHIHPKTDREMLRYSCEGLLDCLVAMYKDKKKTFVQNIVTQVIERHLVRGLDKILSPVRVNTLSDEDVLKIAAESASVQRQRTFLVDRLEKLKHGQAIFREVMGSVK
ncbi:hypothetical protein PV04_09727 [Phialophora macrospora]|uniref:GED domain-containing protein n=1 Tax=Phialophora macrospora TaxID=1851006 RepID=A0A0D2FD47_9EURO|nr:hypothetical protein PV04_09727 [Phialophora macrospora]